MKITILVASILLSFSFAEAAFVNPDISKQETLEIYDYIDKCVGFVTATVSIKLKEEGGKKYLIIDSKEGAYYQNYITLNYSDLSTVSEKRYSLPDNKLLEDFHWLKKDQILFYNRDKSINEKIPNSDRIYSRYAYFVALRGFPFETEDEVSVKTYMFEYGNSLQMNIVNLGKVKVKVRAGEFVCYKLEMSVGGWQKYFAPDKYYLYFSVNKPHQFIKFDQKVDTGQWLSNELISYSTKKK